MSRYAIEDYTQVRHVTTKTGCAADEGGAGPREGTPVVARQGVDDEYHLSPDAVGGHPAASAGHPLDPLDAGEIMRAVEILRREPLVTPQARFVSVSLSEPRKDQIVFAAQADCPAADQPAGTGHSGPPDDAVPREAFVVFLEPRQHATYEAVVSLTAGSVLSCRPVPGARAPVSLAEYVEWERVTRADSRVRAGLERRGITSSEQVLVEAWGVGAFTAPEDAGRWVVWTLLFYRDRPDDNPYAKPIHGLHAIVDLDDMTVVRVEDLGVVPLPPGSGAYAAGRTGPLRDDLKPIEIVQPQGPSFEVCGCLRLDMAVDGLCNTVYEVDTEAITPVPGNPLGNAFRPVKRPLRRESEAQRVIDLLCGRYWLVANPVGHPIPA